MYSTDVSVEIHSVYQKLAEGLEEQVHSVQDSLLQLQQLLTDLPHDMLDDSGDQLSNFSDCSAPEDHEQVCKPWNQDAQWEDHPNAANPQNDYEQGQNLYADHFLYEQGNLQDEMHVSDWPNHHNEEEGKSMYEISGRASEDGSDDVYLGGDGYKAPKHYQQNQAKFYLPENFKPYPNGHPQEFDNQPSKMPNFVDAKKLHFTASETANSQSVEPCKVIYNPYCNNVQQPVPISSDAARRTEAFEEMQQEFLGTGENCSDNMQILQLQVLNKAKGRQLEELNGQLDKQAQQIRYLSHQLAIVKDEKDGMYLSLQESQKLCQNGKEREIQLEGQIKALETQIQTLAANEEQLVKQSKVAEVAMESMQQQLLELRRSDSLQRARDQHEAIVAALKQKYEEQGLSLQQKLDARHAALQEQTELCCHLRNHVKQLERTLEESKLEKTEIISRLSKSLEESQNQCANLLQTGLVHETNQLRIQLQQAQAAQLLSSEMNHVLQEELKELKEEIVLYESAAKCGVFLGDPGGELNDSYVDLGIKKVNKKTKLHSACHDKEVDKELSKDEIILQLKVELERLLSSNKIKRSRISQLQNDLKDCQRATEDLKQKPLSKGKMIENSSGVCTSPSAAENNLTEEILKLKKENLLLQQEAERHSGHIQELKENEEKLKSANQDLCSQMRQMIKDFDQDKQEAIDRCERTYQQHYEDVKKNHCKELVERHAAEKEKLIHAYEENSAQLKADIDELNREMITVKECYVAVCREKDEQESALKAALEQEQELKEEKKKLLEEQEEYSKRLRTELEVTYKSQWQKEKEADIKQSLENEVATLKAQWEREQKEAEEQNMAEVEREWQHRLAHALEETKRNLVELRHSCSQTEPVTTTNESLSQAMVEEQTLAFQEALREKEKALREHEAGLERRHNEKLATQVELALTKARSRWLQELTELEEFKAHLKAARDQWEKECEINTAKQVSLALSAIDEKWKKEFENSDNSRVRIRELEERILSLKRELKLKEDEVSAFIKAELAKARAHWNKEKQEELLGIQEQNEKDYHSFLRDHNNKVHEVLTKAKDEFAKQKQELLDQKEAELKVRLDRQQQEWAVQEAKRFQNEVHQYEERILVQLELLLDEMHKDVVNCGSDEHGWHAKWSPPPFQINLHFKQKLMLCLQKAFKDTVCTILEKAKQEWKEVIGKAPGDGAEDAGGESDVFVILLNVRNVGPLDQWVHHAETSGKQDLEYNFKDPAHSFKESGEGETGDKARPIYDVGQQVELQRILKKQTTVQETEQGIDLKCKTKSLRSQEDFCCEQHSHQQLERKERECQDLKRKLDKACRHLQFAVKEHKAKSELVLENEKIVQTLMEENSAMKNKLEDLKLGHVPPRSSSEGYISKSCTSCDGKGLEEMRCQYIKAVSKIKSDMLRYIHESKERAAEIIKTEILRERQETARKMRKYYLVCLQQLLIDDGKHEGAEKRIICAAGKLATMAKILETPVRSSVESKVPHSALLQNSKPLPGTEDPQRNGLHHPVESQMLGRRSVRKTNDQVSQKRIPCSLRQLLDSESQSALASSTEEVGGASSKEPGDTPAGFVSVLAVSKHVSGDQNLAAPTNPSSCTSQAQFQNVNAASCADGTSDSGATCMMSQCQKERRILKEFRCNQSIKCLKATSENPQGFDRQETPVRDEGSSTDWSLVSEILHLDGSNMSLHQKVQLAPHDHFPIANLFSHTKEASVFCQQAGGNKDKTVVTRSQVTNGHEDPPPTNCGRLPHQTSEQLNPAGAQPRGVELCSAMETACNFLHTRKHAHDVKAFQQDSGFDSPQINFD